MANHAIDKAEICLFLMTDEMMNQYPLVLLSLCQVNVIVMISLVNMTWYRGKVQKNKSSREVEMRLLIIKMESPISIPVNVC